MKILLAIMAAILACTATAMAVTPGDLHTKNFGCAGNGTTDDTVNFQSNQCGNVIGVASYYRPWNVLDQRAIGDFVADDDVGGGS